MMPILERISVAALLTSLLYLLPLSTGAEPIRIGALHLPPFYILDADQTKVTGGIYIDRLRKILNRAKIDYVFEGFPPKRLYTNFAEGKIQLIIASVGNNVIEGKGLLSHLPLGENIIELYSLLPKAQIPTNPDELSGKQVIIMQGYSYAGLIDVFKEKHVNMMPTLSHETGFQMLAAGRAPYMLGYQGISEESMKKSGLLNINTVPMKTIQVLIQINKETPYAQQIMDKCMKAMKELKAEGEI